VLDRGRPERGEVASEVLHPGLALLPRDAEITEAHLVGATHLRVRPHAAVLARVHGDGDAVAEVDRLTAGDADHALGRHAGLLHQPHALVAGHEPGIGVGQDPLRAVEVVEVGVADHDPVALVDVAGGEAGAGCARHAVDVGVAEDGETCRAQSERGAAVPVEGRRGRCHGITSSAP
jgi:hypothetical protein